MSKRPRPTKEALALGKRLKDCRTLLRLSQAKFGKEFGVTRNAVSMWEAGKSAPENWRMKKIATFCDRAYEWLSTGRGSERRNNTTIEGLRQIGKIAAGQWHEVVESQDMEEKRVPVAPVPGYPIEAQYALQVEGSSLDRIAKDGAIIHCVDVGIAGLSPHPGDLVCVERTRAGLVETTVKRLRAVNGALELWPESDDPRHQEMLPYKPPKGNGEVSIKAVVVGVWQPIPRGT